MPIVLIGDNLEDAGLSTGVFSSEYDIGLAGSPSDIGLATDDEAISPFLTQFFSL